MDDNTLSHHLKPASKRGASDENHTRAEEDQNNKDFKRLTEIKEQLQG